MSSTTGTTVESKNLALDAPGLGITPDSVDGFLELAAAGIIGAGANNCGAVQNNQALRPDTTIQLSDGAIESDESSEQ